MATNIKYWTRKLSSRYILDERHCLATTGLLLLGVIAGLLQVHLRYPLNIPGHHGLEWMALLLLGRLMSEDQKAATWLASAAALTFVMQMPLVTTAQSLKPAGVFILTGICADLLYRLTGDRLNLYVKGAVIGGLAFIAKPILFYPIFILGGVKLGMFIKHPDYFPFISHLVFGAVGGVGGAILASQISRNARSG